MDDSNLRCKDTHQDNSIDKKHYINKINSKPIKVYFWKVPSKAQKNKVYVVNKDFIRKFLGISSFECVCVARSVIYAAQNRYREL